MTNQDGGEATTSDKSLEASSEDRWLASIVASTDDAVLTKGLDGIIKTWNDGAARMYGYEADEVIGRHVSMLGPDRLHHEFTEFLEHVRLGEQVQAVETVRRKKDGQEFEVSVTVSPVFDAAGQLVGASTIAHDISRRKEVERNLVASQAQLNIITSSVTDGITIQDAEGHLVYANLAAARASGYATPEALLEGDPASLMERFEMFGEDGQPIDWGSLPGRRALQGEREPEVTVRVRDRTTGEETWRVIGAAPVFHPDGRVSFAVNTIRDVTLLRTNEQELRLKHLILEAETEASAEGIVVVEASGRIISTNSRLQSLWGLPPEHLVTDEAFLAGVESLLIDHQPFAAHVGALRLDTQQVITDDLHLLDDRSIRFLTRPLTGETGETYGRIWFFRDISIERQEEGKQRFLLDASRLLASSLDYEMTLSQVADLTVPILADWSIIDLVADDGGLTTLAVAHRDPEKVKWARLFREEYPVNMSDPTGVPSVIRSGVSELYPVVEGFFEESLKSTDDEHLRTSLLALDIRSVMIVPLAIRGVTFGALTFVCSGSGRRFDDEDLLLAENLATLAAIAIDNSRAYRDRDQIAEVLQRSLLPPDLPKISGLELAACYVPSGSGFDVGGDFYDMFPTGETSWGLLMGDVCGKGPEAAALTALARYTIQAAATQASRPSEILETLNQAVFNDRRDDRFCTVCYARVVPSTTGVRMTVCSGGHPLPLVLRANGMVETAGVFGSLIGVLEQPVFHDVVLDLGPGDAFILYTDGVTDEQRDGEEFGDDRLHELVAGGQGESASSLVARIEDAVRSYGNGDPRDDVAVVVLKMLG